MTEELKFDVVTEEIDITFKVDQIGPQGPKPKKGTDYWTEEDRAEISTEIDRKTQTAADEAVAAEKAERMAADAATGRALEEETTARQNAFAESERQMQAEREARAAADTELQTAIDGKQPTLTAGDHITISGNVISAEVPEAPVTDVKVNGASVVQNGVANVPQYDDAEVKAMIVTVDARLTNFINTLVNGDEVSY